MKRRKRKIFYFNDSNRQRMKNANLRQPCKNLQKRRSFCSKYIAWKVLKIIIFIICLVYFSIQSNKFLTDYYTYPTTTKFTVLKPERFEMPCITICNTNPIKRSKFCNEYPHLCEPPNNLTSFCSKHPHMCSGNISNLLIPKLGYYSTGAITKIISTVEDLYENQNFSVEEWSNWTWDIPTGYSYSKREMTTILVRGRMIIGHPTCYSANVRFSNKLEASFWPIRSDPRERGSREETFSLNLEENESFFPWKIPQILLAVHSPYSLIHPIEEGDILKIGHNYLIGVKLEGENLLPYPYQTDCTDYHKLWKDNNKTGPRSQEVCRQWCFWNSNKKCKKFPRDSIMVQYSENTCELKFQNNLSLTECLNYCKADCRKLKYKYKMVQLTSDDTGYDGMKSHEIIVYFSIDDPQVVLMSHIPLYTEGDLFSHIGGLMGCWLGISVATFAGILESAFTEVKHLTSRFRRNFKRSLKPQH